MANKVYGVPDRDMAAPVGAPDRKLGMPKRGSKAPPAKSKPPIGAAKRGRPDAKVC